MSSCATTESIPAIIRDLDCIQETQQFSVSIEHNWSVQDICQLIASKQPGQKVESAQFSFTPTSLPSSKPKPPSSHLATPPVPDLCTKPAPIQQQLLTDYFLAHSRWRMQISSASDPEFVSISLQLSHSIEANQHAGSSHCPAAASTNLTVKMGFYLFNSDLTDTFARNTDLQVNFSLAKFFTSLATTPKCRETDKASPAQTVLVESFSVEKFCRLRDLLGWLNSQKSADFCLISELKFYKDRQQLAPSPCQLLLTYKHAWTVKNWKDFLRWPAEASSHTFMNDTEIASLFTEATPAVRLDRLRSKLFSLNCEQEEEEAQQERCIEELLRHVKWKLQLYPAGYSSEFGQSLSLFVNLSELTGQLAAFSSPVSKKKSRQPADIAASLRLNNAKTLEETFYDSSPHTGLLLLVKPGEHKLHETFVKASFQVSMLDSQGKKVDKCQSERQLFELFGSWGYKEYMSAKDLQDKCLAHGQTSLDLHCKIALFYTLTARKAARLESTAPPPAPRKRRPQQRAQCNSLLHDLRRLYSSAHLCDLTLRAPVCCDSPGALQEFKAHALILSVRSEVFEKMLCQPGRAHTVDIVDFDASTVAAFLHFLYTDQVDPGAALQELFKIADKYAVHRLREVCEARLVRSVSAENCVELLILAYLHSSPRLKQRCFGVLAADVAAVISQAEWTFLESNYPALLAEAFRALYFKKACLN